MRILHRLQNMAHLNALTPAEQIAFWSSFGSGDPFESNNNNNNNDSNSSSNKSNNNNDNATDASLKKIGKPGRKPVRDPNKPFQCTLCEYSSKSKSNFTIHMRIHTGEKPFACTQCSYRTSQKGNLRIHQERRHSQQPRSSLPAYFMLTSNHPQNDSQTPATSLSAFGSSLGSSGIFPSRADSPTSITAPTPIIEPDEESSNPCSPPSL